MSTTEHLKGKLVSTGKSLEDYIGDDWMKSGIYDSPNEYFDDNYYRAAYLIDGVVFEVANETIVDPDFDIFESKALDSEGKKFEYEIRFYNGGCSHREAIEYALKNKD